MKSLLTTAAIAMTLSLTSLSAAQAGALPTLPENMVFPTDFDGFVSDKGKRKAPASE